MNDHETGPFGHYEKGTSGHVLNALCDYGVPLTVVENIQFNKGELFFIGATREHYGRYKYFDGIDRPLFSFQNQALMAQPIVLQHDGTKKAKFRLNLSVHGTPGFIISGKDATPQLHAFIRYPVLTNMMTHECYKLHQAAGAFFQGGSNDPNGEFIYLEFWKPEGAQAVVDYINEHYKPE